jgi:hypothetical protein
MTRFAAALLVAALLPFAAPQPAHAQLGGLIKRKVKEAIKAPEKTSGDQKPTAAESKPGRPTVGTNSNVFEITEPVFAGVIRGLETEIRLQSEFRAELAKYPTQEQYDQCLLKVAQSPEYAKIRDAFAKTMESKSSEQLTAATQKMGADLDALTNKLCPVKPASTDWPPDRRTARLDSIRVRAADSASGDTVSIAGFAGWTVQQYAIAIERIERLCDYNNSPAGSTTNNPATGGNLTIKGTGTNVFWVFTSRETGVLNSASCRRFRDLNKRLL